MSGKTHLDKPTERRVAVITGAASGIGAALAREADARGFDLALGDVQDIDTSSYRTAISSSLDVSDQAQMDRFATAVYGQFGRCDFLFNNAGIMRPGRSWDQSRDHWDKVIAVNFGGVVNGVRAFTSRMIEAGRPAHIINTASLAGLVAAPGLGAYGVSKHAAVAFSETLSLDLQAAGAPIKVSVICPGAVNTEIMAAAASAVTDDDAAKATADEMHKGTKAVGASPDRVAKTVFDAVEAGQFWIRPLDEPVAGLEQRARQIKSGEAPAFSGWS